MYELETNNH